MPSDIIVWPDLKSKVPRIDQALKQALAEAENEGHRLGFEKGQKEGREAADIELAELRVRYGEAVRKLDATRLTVEAEQVRWRVEVQIDDVFHLGEEVRIGNLEVVLAAVGPQGVLQ